MTEIIVHPQVMHCSVAFENRISPGVAAEYKYIYTYIINYIYVDIKVYVYIYIYVDIKVYVYIYM